MKIITPENKGHWLRIRCRDVTSTEVSALFNLNPYVSHFELWHNKKDQVITQIDESDRMKWGTRLQDAIASGIAEDNGWIVRPIKYYGRLEAERAGSSFDFEIEILSTNQTGLLEIKNVDALQFKEKWIIEDGEVVEAPPHIELQVQHQLMVTGYEVAYIGALIGGNKVALLKRTPDKHIIEKIKEKIKKFWESIDNNRPPAPDFIKDAEFISKLYSYASPGSVMNGDDNDRLAVLVNDYKEISEQIKKLEESKGAAKAEMLMLIGDNEKVKADGYSISATVIGPKEISYTRSGYRDFRIFKKGEKK